MCKIINFTADQKAEVILKDVLYIKDIQVLKDCGKQKATKLRNECIDWIEAKYEKKYPIDMKSVPTNEFVECFKIDTDVIHNNAIKYLEYQALKKDATTYHSEASNTTNGLKNKPIQSIPQTHISVNKARNIA